jgi:hypothetical protein
MKRMSVVLILGALLFSTMACLVSPGVNPPIATPARFETTGNRKTFSDEYSCGAIDKVILIVGDDGIATLTTTGPVYVDYINCTKDPSGFEATFVIIGAADPDTEEITFTSCNDGGFTAKGTISIRNGSPIGTVSCIYSQGDDAGKTRMTLLLP